MPAPKSILRQERRPFAPVDTAIKLFKKCMTLSGKIPKRHKFSFGDRIICLAGDVMDNTKAANMVYPTNGHEAQIRRDYWIKARSALAALSNWIDRILEAPGEMTYRDEAGRTKGVKITELEEVAGLIYTEMELLTNQLIEEKERYNKLK